MSFIAGLIFGGLLVHYLWKYWPRTADIAPPGWSEEALRKYGDKK